MTLKVIGAGVGRTGTYSLRMALEKLGFGPCHHMEDVLNNMPVQLPLWNDAIGDRPDWAAIYKGYAAAVDWPTACFFRELSAAYPDARFILGVRSPESWAASFSATIYELVSRRAQAIPDLQPWLEMVARLIAKTGFPADLDEAGLKTAFIAHNEAVKAAIPADKLLVYQIKDGWGPLCDFLGVTAPDEPFPRSNDRREFWDLIPGVWG